MSLGRAAARFLLAALALAAVQCRGTDPEALYVNADFLEARKHFNKDECEDLEGEAAKRCSERAAHIAEALAGAAQFLTRRANELSRHTKQIQFNKYDEAIQSLELALEILPEDHRSRSELVAGIERIKKLQVSLEGELNEQLARLKTMLETGTYDPEVWTDIRLTFERVRVIVLAIGKPDDRPRALARELVDKFRTHGQYEHARIATQLAEAVETSGMTAQRYTDAELVLFGVIDYLAQQQESRRQAKITSLAREAVAAFEAKRVAEAGEKAHAALKLGPTERTARQMRTILEQTEGASGQVQRAKEARRIVETSADLGAVPVEDIEPAGPGDEEEVAQPAPARLTPPAVVDKRPADVRLKEILRLYEKKQLYEALSALEVLHRDVTKASERRRVAKLRQVWTPDRKRLTADIVQEADRLFVLMDERSLDEYSRALRLSPEGATADHVNERIQTLQLILSN